MLPALADRAARAAAVIFALSVAGLGCTQRGPDAVTTLPADALVAAPKVSPIADPHPTAVAPAQIQGQVLPTPAVRGTATVRVEPAGATRVDEVTSVYLDIDVTGADPGTELSLELVANGTTTYERRTSALESGPEAIQRRTFQLPVAGTIILNGGLTGDWAAKFFLNGEPLTQTTFRLDP